jgi:hypothetical protein
MDVNIFLIRQNDVNHGHRLQLPQSTVNFIGRMPCSKNAEPAQWTAASGFILKMYPVLFFFALDMLPAHKHVGKFFPASAYQEDMTIYDRFLGVGTNLRRPQSSQVTLALVASWLNFASGKID